MGALRIPILVATAALVIALSTPARADTVDEHYLSVLSALGIPGDRDQLIADGHAACDAYGTPGVVGEVFGLVGQGMSNIQASNVILAGVRSYCPEKAPPS
jgi:uncharacterized protein DUF732